MAGGRPRTRIGTYGEIAVSSHGTRHGRRHRASTRYRDFDGRLREVACTARSASLARTGLKERLLERNGYGSNGLLSHASSFTELVLLWTEDMQRLDLAEGTKRNYLETLKYVEETFAYYTLGEITTGRVERFLRDEGVVSYSRAKHARSILSLLFGFALRHDAINRNPLEGTSRLKKPAGAPKALSIAQIAAIRAAAAAWRTEPGLSGPKSDGQVKDLIEVLLGSSLRPGEALAIRACDIAETKQGMVIEVCGTIIPKKGKGFVRQDHPKTHHSVRRIVVAPFAATVIRERLKISPPSSPEDTVFRNRTGGPLSLHNVRRTFREFLRDAGLESVGIELRWYRRTGATVIARGGGVNLAAGYLGHGNTAITEAHYIEPDPYIDATAAEFLDRTLRAEAPDLALLTRERTTEEHHFLAAVEVDEELGSGETSIQFGASESL